eukprot:gene33778-biopygen36040
MHLRCLVLEHANGIFEIPPSGRIGALGPLQPHLQLRTELKSRILLERWELDGRRAAERAPRTELVAGCKVYWSKDDAWYTGTVGDTGPNGLTHIAYEDGDKEDLDMSKEKYEVIPAAVQEMQGAAFGGKTVGNYQPKARALMTFCEAENREWLPSTGATVRLYIAHMLDKDTVRASNMQPYLSAINNYHEDMGFPGLAKGRAVSSAVKGMSHLHVQAADAA